MLYPLMRARLEMSVAMAARQHAAAPDNDYLLISQAGVREVLDRLAGRGRHARALPLPRRVRLRGQPAGARRPPVPRAHPRAPRHGGRPRERAGARPRRGDAARRRAGDRALRRGALDLHRARVPDAGRALADAAHGGRHLRARGRAGVRAVRRGRRGSREPRPARRLRRAAGARARRLLHAARASRPVDARERDGSRRASSSPGSARRRSTAAGSRTCTCSCSRSWSPTSRAWR